MKYYFPVFLLTIFLFFSCSDNESSEPNVTNSNLIFKIKFNSSQERLDSFGQIADIPNGNAAQSPNISLTSIHYIELVPNENTQFGEGEIVYRGAETDAAGETAIDFDNAIIVGNNEIFKTIPIETINTNNYSYIRIMATYQKGTFDFLHPDGTIVEGEYNLFLGNKTFFSELQADGCGVINNFNTNSDYGYCHFGVPESPSDPGICGITIIQGDITEVNPINASSSVPENHGVITGVFENGLNISGNEPDDIVITLSLSTNNSMEWSETIDNGFYESYHQDENFVDCGFRGLIPFVE